jgi:hypothetical protein
VYLQSWARTQTIITIDVDLDKGIQELKVLKNENVPESETEVLKIENVPESETAENIHENTPLQTNI